MLQVTGAYLAIMVTGTAVEELFPTGPHDAFPWWAAYPARFVFVIGILLAFNMSWKQFVPAMVTLWIVTAVAQVSTMTYGGVAGTFIAMTVGTMAVA